MLVTLPSLAALLVLLGAARPPSPPEGITGTYAVTGTAHVSVSPFPAHDYPGELTATLARTAGSEALSLRVEARGYACTLQVQVGADGSLEFPEKATCPLEVTQPDARGHLDAQLRTARARVHDGRLELALEFDVKGSIQMRIPSKTIRIFGGEYQSPATWAPSAPLHGTVAASGQGNRRDSATR